MRLLVKRLMDDTFSDFECVDIDTQKKHIVDFHISGSKLLPKVPTELIGKIVTVEYLTPYLELSGDVYAVTEANAKKIEELGK